LIADYGGFRGLLNSHRGNRERREKSKGVGHEGSKARRIKPQRGRGVSGCQEIRLSGVAGGAG